MGTVSVSVPEELKQKMVSMDEINWSAIARKAFEEQVKQVEFMKAIAKKSKLTEKDADEISEIINKGVARRLRRK